MGIIREIAEASAGAVLMVSALAVILSPFFLIDACIMEAMR